MVKKVLIFYIGFGDGHKRAAQALEKSFKKRNIEVLSKDMGDKYPLITAFTESWYLWTIRFWPSLWRSAHASKWLYPAVKTILTLLQYGSLNKYEKVIRSYNPDIIICTYAFCAGAVSKLNLKTPLIAVATDHHMHDYWFYKNVSTYFVANNRTRDYLIKKKINPKKIVVSGIPVNPEFYKKNKIKKKDLNLRNVPTVLVMGGSLGLGPLKKISQELNNCDKDLQVLVMVGRNKTLQKNIKQTKKVKVIPYNDRIHDYMSVADLLITKPSGITTSEAIIKELPMVLMKAIPGQEEKNIPFLLKKGVAMRGNKNIILDLLEDKDLYKRIQYNQKRLKKIYKDIIEHILK